MDKLRTEGAAQKLAGRAKEAIGKVTGDSKLQAEGQADKTAGGVKNAIGGVADSIRDADRKTRR